MLVSKSHTDCNQWRSQECELGAPPSPPPFNGGPGGITLTNFFEIKGAHR